MLFKYYLEFECKSIDCKSIDCNPRYSSIAFALRSGNDTLILATQAQLSSCARVKQCFTYPSSSSVLRRVHTPTKTAEY